jgi:hypothetical protein
MKNLYIILLLLLTLTVGKVSAQSTSGESFGTTLNFGLGIGYYGYIGSTAPALNFNLEFDVLPSFTLAPFVTVYSYRNYHYWSNYNYYYRSTVIPFGVKGAYYFDRLLGAGSRWDFYLAGSLGLAVHTTRWENGYNGDWQYDRGTTGLYLDAHIGAEYHASDKLGIYLDLSTGLSTLGLAIHL